MTWCADRCQQFQIVYLQVPLAWRSTIFSFSLFSSVNGVNAKTVPRVMKWLLHALPLAMHHLLTSYCSTLYNSVNGVNAKTVPRVMKWLLHALPLSMHHQLTSYCSTLYNSVNGVNARTVPRVMEWLLHALPLAMHHLLSAYCSTLYNSVKCCKWHWLKGSHKISERVQVYESLWCPP